MNEKIILNGGHKIQVEEFPEAIFVKQLPLSALEDWLQAQNKEAEMIALAIGKPVEWVDANLSPASQVLLLDAAEEINMDFFQSWLRRRVKRMEAMVPGSAGEMIKLLQPQVSPSPTGSPASAP